MTLPDPLAAYNRAPLGDLLAILLRQFRRPLTRHGIDLTDAEAETIAHALAQRTDPGDKATGTSRRAGRSARRE